MRAHVLSEWRERGLREGGAGSEGGGVSY